MDKKFKVIREKIQEPNLEELDWLQPSDQVWKKVKATLPKKKRRPVLLPLILVGLSLFSVGIYLMNNENSKIGPIASTESITSYQGQMAPQAEGANEVKQYKNKAPNQVINASEIKSETTPIPKAYFKTSGKPASKTTRKERSDANEKQKINNAAASQPAFAQILSPNVPVSEGPSQINNNNTVPSVPYLAAIPPSFQGEATMLELPGLTMVNNVRTSIIPLSTQSLLGISVFHSFAQDKKAAKLEGEPLNELLTQSVYKNHFSFGLTYNQVLNNHFSWFVNPSINLDNLYSTYILNIPYDYNTEVTTSTEKENYFNHSLPTDIGNIKTNLVVTRALNSPVDHNEIINFDFTSRIKTIHLALPIGVTYHVKGFNKSWYFSPAFVPEFELNRAIYATYLKSNHTFVHTKDASISPDYSRSSFHMGLRTGLGYRWALGSRINIDLGTGYTYYFNRYGRRNLWNAGLTIMTRI